MSQTQPLSFMSPLADIEDSRRLAGVCQFRPVDAHSARAPRLSQLSPLNPQPSTLHHAFTLIEIMIVVAIMGVVLTMSVPIVYKAWHKAPMSKAVSEIMEVCSHARQQAIMKGVEESTRGFHPKEGRFEVGSGPAGIAEQSTNNAPPAPSFSSGVVSSSASGFSGRLSEKIVIELMDINKLPHDFREDDLARVRFIPNGTFDELTLILVSDQNERRELTLEVTTGLLSVESDPRKFK